MNNLSTDVEHFIPKMKNKFKKENTAIIRPLHSYPPVKISYDKTILHDCMEYYKNHMNSKWSVKEHSIFAKQFQRHRKLFHRIAEKIKEKSYGDCVLHYYLTKSAENNLKKAVRRLQKKNGVARMTSIEELKCGSSLILNSIMNSNKITTRAKLKLNNCENEENENNRHLVNIEPSKKPTKSSNKTVKKKLASKDSSVSARKRKTLTSFKDNSRKQRVSNIEVIDKENGEKLILSSNSNDSIEQQNDPTPTDQQAIQSNLNNILDNLIDDINDNSSTLNESLIEVINYDDMNWNRPIIANNFDKNEPTSQISKEEIIDLTADSDDEASIENRNPELILDEKEYITLEDVEFYGVPGFVSMRHNISSSFNSL